MRRAWVGPAVLVLAVLAPSCSDLTSSDEGPALPGDRVRADVIRVVDGDTIHVLLDGRDTTVRLIGIDTPEKDGPFTTQECFGSEASAYTSRVLTDATVGLEFDVDRIDRYDRTLAYVWLGDELFDEQILRDGYAVLLTIPPNVKYVERFTAAQEAARDRGAGLWSACPASASP